MGVNLSKTCILQNNCIVVLTLFCHCVGIITVNIELAMINCPTKILNSISNSIVLGKIRGAPSQLSRVCVGPSTSPQHLGRVNISWDPLPCHLQNGADISHGYIIQYTRLPNGVPINISSSDNKLLCRQEPGGPYSCVEQTSFFISGATYSFQVAAQNMYGVGSFSDPVTTVYSSQGKHNN